MTYRIQTTDGSTLTASDETDGWIVTDSDNGVWRPSPEAREEIEQGGDPAVIATRICSEHPMRGTWAS